MKRIAKLVTMGGLLVGLVGLVGCATSGPTFSEMKSTLPIVAEGYGRIYIYRATAVGAAVQPKIFVNDVAVGSAIPKGFLYIDRTPGPYEIKTKTEVERKLSLALEDRQTRYVRLGVSMGFFVGHVYPELVESKVGEKDLQKLHYTGKSRSTAVSSD